MRGVFILVVFALPLATAHAFEWRATGPVRVIDGDSLGLRRAVQIHCPDPMTCPAGQVSQRESIEVRFHGIDAFELAQPCTDRAGTPWACGQAGKAYLTEITAGENVTCYGGGPGFGQDRYGREIGVCYLGDRNLNADMVRLGLALAFRRYSMDYVEIEDKARSLKAGAWGGSFVAPWDWRRGVRQ